MRRGGTVSVLALAGLGLSACASAGMTVPDPGAAKGYLSSVEISRLAEAVPPPSADGSPERAADMALSDRYRTLENSDRWLLATAHAELSPELARQHFDCALGVRFAGTATPHLTAIFARLYHDANGTADLAKLNAFRPRPVGVDPQRPACQTVSPAGRDSASYPSGSATTGSAYGQAMAAVDPDHADAAREIGHQIALSRVVCAMHYPADAAVGEQLGRDVFATASQAPAFRADLALARQELVQVRATGLTNPGCASERAALAVALP